MRICSKPLFITNTLKLAINGIFPTMARPAPTPTMFASAMPQEKKRSRNSFSDRNEALIHHEHAEAGDKRNFPHHGQAGADAHHVRLGDAAGKEAVGKLLFEIGGHG